MISSSTTPAKILIGILSLDHDQSRELLSWAISVLAHPHDHIVAIHFLVGEDTIKRKQSKIRQAKAHVISVLGEFASICQYKQARVGFSSSIAKGLIQEAKSISAHYLILQGFRNKSNRNIHGVTRDCFKHAPESCTVVSLGRYEQSRLHSDSASVKAESNLSNPKWLLKNNNANRVEKDTESRNDTERTFSSRTAIDELADGESHITEGDDSISIQESSCTEYSCPAAQPPNLRIESKARNRTSGFKLISSIFASPLRRKKGNFTKEEKQQPLLNCFSYEEIANATKNFHPDNMVGRGGYSEVYRGDLGDGRAIAVKRLAKDNKDATKEKEFLTELGVTGHVSHPNTAKLIGCCIENGLYLIFNLSQNGNLASALHGKTSKCLEWEVRYRIAIGVAKGLHYLHKCCKHRIIHRDIKASNVLLGPDFEPQITDFGLAKWLPNKWTHHAVMPIEGTFGYLAPEYFMHGIVDEKTDVFAFGILLLEIVSGRRPVDSSKQNLLLWAKPLMESGKMEELADPKLKGKFDEDQMYNVVQTASLCVRQSSVWRPSMSEVLELLTSGQGTEVARSWRTPKFTSDESDDFSMAFGYHVPLDIALEDFL